MEKLALPPRNYGDFHTVNPHGVDDEGHPFCGNEMLNMVLQWAVPPSRNRAFQWLTAYNNTPHNSMKPAVADSGELLSGKWIIYKSATDIDEAWLRVKGATELGFLGYESAVRTFQNDVWHIPFRIIRVSTYNAFDENDVLRVRHALGDLGFRFSATAVDGRLMYETDADPSGCARIHYTDWEEVQVVRYVDCHD